MKKKTGRKAARAPKRRKRAWQRRRFRACRVGRARSGGQDDRKAEIRRLRTQLAQALKRIEELQAQADTDFLLDIPNRRGFERELNRAISYIKRYHASGALIVLDVDRLKPINDAFGHAAGDQVLKAVAAELSRHVRSSDVVGRLGGDEFAVLLWNLSETDAKAKAGAGTGHRPAQFRLSRPHRHRGRIGRRSHSRPACGSRPGRSRRLTARCMCARRNGGMNRSQASRNQ